MINNPYQPQMMTYTPGYNPYQYNPVQRFQEQQLPQQPVQQIPQQQNLQIQAGINGRMVAAVEQIAANDVPMDGSVAFFPKQDLTEIYAKSWNADGTIRTLTFKPVLNDKTDILSCDTEKLEFDLSEKATEGIMAKLNELSEKIEQLSLGTQRKISRTQNKESEKA